MINSKIIFGNGKLLLFLFLFLLSLTSAELGNTNYQEKLGTFEQNKTVVLQQVCNNCSYVNLTKVIFPNSTIAMLGQFAMTKNGTNYNYSYSETLTLGTYTYTTCGDLNGNTACQMIEFEITPSGKTGNLGFYIILIGLVYLIGFFGFFGRNVWVSMLGGIGMLALGVYFIGEGVIIYRDWLTNAISYLTIGLGAIFTLVPIIEFIGKEL